MIRRVPRTQSRATKPKLAFNSIYLSKHTHLPLIYHNVFEMSFTALTKKFGAQFTS